METPNLHFLFENCLAFGWKNHSIGRSSPLCHERTLYEMNLQCPVILFVSSVLSVIWDMSTLSLVWDLDHIMS